MDPFSGVSTACPVQSHITLQRHEFIASGLDIIFAFNANRAVRTIRIGMFLQIPRITVFIHRLDDRFKIRLHRKGEP